MKKTVLSLAALIFCAGLFAQNGKKINPSKVKGEKINLLNHPHDGLNKIHKCYTDQATEKYFNANPDARKAFENSQKAQGAWENIDETAKLNNPNSVFNPPPSPLDTIPIVFHILHENGPENISNQVVYNVVEALNSDYQKLDADTSTIEPFFQARATSCNLVFKLATIDPNGNCTNGIIRHFDANTNWDQNSPGYAYTGTTSGKWDPRKYMNIYIVKAITDGGGTGGGTIVGYTYRPGTWPSGNAADCIVYNASFLDIPSKEYRSLSHEIGHWLNLAHTFGSTNQPGVSCGDDNLGTISGQPIDDTPKTLGFFSTCPAAQTPNSCDASNYANVENIMDYSSCPKMFTYGQVRRMRYTLTLSTSGRNNLVTAANKLATGVRNPQVCAPVADFTSDKTSVCINAPAVFSDNTQNAQITSYNWDFPGGTPSTSTAANPSVTYASPGIYAVTYTAINSAGSNVISKTSYITAYNTTAAVQSPFVESFEGITVPNTDWTVDNASGPGWEQTNTVGLTGTNCMKIDNFTNTAGSVETFYTPSFNISGINATAPTVSFTFKLSHQRKSTTASEKLQVYSSTNCGDTWSQRYSKSGSSLATVTGANTSAFTPSSAADWRTETVAISALMAQSNVMFKFVFTSDANGASNNIYVDDINMSNNGVGIKEAVEANLNMITYPNPSSGIVNVSFDVYGKQKVKLELIDVLGKSLETIVNKDLVEGNHAFSFGTTAKLASGIYFTKLTVDGNTIVRKIIVE